MLKTIFFTVSFVILSFSGSAQKNLNDYKYIIIPKSFEFSNSEDQYQLNSLTKFLFNKYGYEAYFSDELPEDLKKERCLALISEVSNEESGMFKTKLEIVLKDCYDAVVIKSQIGESRLKEFDKAYNEALRGAFETFQNMDYKYVAKENVLEKSKEENQPIKEMVKVEELKEVTSTKADDIEKTIEVTTKASTAIKAELYYAQPITNGFQLVNSEPRVVMILLNSSAKDVFIVKDKNAIVFKKDDKWIYSENDGTSRSEKELNIKF